MSSEELFMTCKENSLTIINIPTEIINNCNNLSLIFEVEKRQNNKYQSYRN